MSEVAIFAGGCFWCMQPVFDALPGVLSTTVGYIGGASEHPTYEEVSGGRSGHAEAIQIVFDPSQVSYDSLLLTFWHNIDPTVKNRQFCDVGTQYRTSIFYTNEEQKRLAEASKAALLKNRDMPIMTEIVSAGPFYSAEQYHQKYYMKNPARYKMYHDGCGREERLTDLWS